MDKNFKNKNFQIIQHKPCLGSSEAIITMSMGGETSRDVKMPQNITQKIRTIQKQKHVHTR